MQVLAGRQFTENIGEFPNQPRSEEATGQQLLAILDRREFKERMEVTASNTLASGREYSFDAYKTFHKPKIAFTKVERGTEIDVLPPKYAALSGEYPLISVHMHPPEASAVASPGDFAESRLATYFTMEKASLRCYPVNIVMSAYTGKVPCDTALALFQEKDDSIGFNALRELNEENLRLIREGGDVEDFERGFDKLIENANVGILFYDRRKGRYHSEGYTTWLSAEMKPRPLAEVLKAFKPGAEVVEGLQESMINM